MRVVAVLLLFASPLLAAEPKMHKDLFYTDAKSKSQSVDVYAPADGKNLPIVVWIHGGGWQKGDKAEVDKKPQAFVDKGYVFVSVNYRLFPDATIKQMGEDVAKAIRWTHDHAKDYGGDPNSLIVTGHSAGAQLAALVCTDDRFLKAEKLSLTIVKGCIPVDGDTYDVPMQIETVEQRRSDIYTKKFGDVSSQKDLSPVTHVARGKDIPPVLILHVAEHPETRAQSQRLVKALQAVDLQAKTYAASNCNHVTLNSELGTPDNKPTQAMFEFIAAVLQPRKAEQPTAWTAALTLKVKRVGSVQVSPDGKRVVYAVREAILDNDKSEYRTHLYLANADGSNARPLTQGEKSCDDPQWSPDGKTIAFVSSRSGKKNLWAIPAEAGEAVQLTTMKGNVGGYKWSPNGKSLAFTAMDAPTADELFGKKIKNDVIVVDENIKMYRLYVIALGESLKPQGEPRLLTKDNYSVGGEGTRAGRAAFDWSPDGKTIVFSHTRTPSPDDWPTADLSLVEVATGKVKALLNSNAAESAPHFSPDGKLIAFVMSDTPTTWAGAGKIYVVPVEGGKPTALADTRDGFGRYSDLIGWSTDGTKLYFSEIQGTTFKLLALPLKGEPVVLNQTVGMSLGGVSLNPSRTTFGWAWETLTQPSEAYIGKVEKLEPVQVSQVNRDLPKLPLGKTEVIRWKSSDDLEIEGLLTYPVGYEKGQRYPLLLVVHGGPMGAFTQSFDGNANPYPVAVFAAQGYAVLRPNPRGSSGYGKKFRHANYNDWGNGDFKDIMAGVDHVIKMGVGDTEKLGVMGWSYGGFMTSWTITQTKRFKAASVGAGVTNLMSFTGTADIPGFLPDYFGGEFWDKPEAYSKHSAMFQVKGVTTPTLIQHGERDERVPLSQGKELYNALKRQGCTTKMVIYPRTPHGIDEPRLLQDAMTRNLEWFGHYIGDKSRVETRK